MDLHALALQLYGFCPDIVEQGVGSVDKLQDSLRQTHTVYLWWELQLACGPFGCPTAA